MQTEQSAEVLRVPKVSHWYATKRVKAANEAVALMDVMRGGKVADITMCEGLGCCQAEKCYRHMAAPSKLNQSYFAKSPMTDKDNCEYFSPERRERTECQELLA